VFSVDGASTGIIHCDDSHSLADWIRAITSNITGLLTQMVSVLCYNSFHWLSV